MSKNPVVHFEMPYKDMARVSAFYEKAFGWKMADMGGEEMGHYLTAETTEVGPDTRPLTPGNINGGFYPLEVAPTSVEPSVVIGVEDIEKAMDDVKAAGGELLGEPMDIPGIGLYVSFRDTERNRVSILQPKGM